MLVCWAWNRLFVRNRCEKWALSPHALERRDQTATTYITHRSTKPLLMAAREGGNGGEHRAWVGPCRTAFKVACREVGVFFVEKWLVSQGSDSPPLSIKAGSTTYLHPHRPRLRFQHCRMIRVDSSGCSRVEGEPLLSCEYAPQSKQSAEHNTPP